MGSSAPDTQQTTTDTSQKEKSVSKTAQDYTGTTAGTTAQQQAQQQAVTLPEYLQSFVPGAVDLTQQGLQNFATAANQYQLPPEALQGLQATAGGDYLYGGPAQQAYIDASLRAAMPGINTQFEGAGRLGGGLYNAQIAQQGQDAYARLYDAERNRQQAAQLGLPGLTMLPLQLQQQLAQLGPSAISSLQSLFGQTGTGTSTGQTTGETAGSQTSKTKSTGTSTGQTVQTQPVYETPWWQTALGAGAALGGLAMPGLGGASALGNIGAGLFGQSAMNNAAQGGLLGLFR